MQSYRLDPKKLPQLTPDEARRLAESPLDYSDIPPLGDQVFSQAKRAQPLLLCLDFEASGSGPRG